jgi:hypothetical protein
MISMPDTMIEIMQDNLNELNESQRESPFLLKSLAWKIETVSQARNHTEARMWLSPPDPWKNHNTARESHHDGTSKWFIDGDTFVQWKSSGPDSLLWIHGKRAYLSFTNYHSCGH